MVRVTPLKPYSVEVPIRAGRDAVWAAATQPPLLRQWFGWDYDGLDAEIRHIFVNEATLVAPERMTWADGSYFEVTGDDTSSVVRAVREGPVPDYPDAFDAIEEGWKSFLVQLRHLLERRPEGVRRTLYLTGETTGRQVLELVEGDWHRVGKRVAWAVDAEGFLVVVSGNVPLDEPEAAGMQIVVSTFGLDDEAFAVCRDDWAKRWAPVADGASLATAETPGS
ncbi:activator of HSP90 ATPase [Actinoplanes sp. NPDC051633]|uniref:activator of HSP90 ATPase n=1 Tax=Actinoplanes sp. NPDC051633 TaxID=3155670 RepID=UPI003431BE0E